MGQNNSMRWLGVSAVISNITSLNNLPAVGEFVREPSTDHEYCFIYNDCNSELKTGDGVVLCSNASAGSVTLSSVSGANMPFGLVKNASIATGCYGFVLTKGFGRVNMHADVSAAVGEPLFLGANGKFGNKSISTGAMANVVGQALSAIASGVSGPAFFKV